jgi:hypothetical protein
MMSFPPIAEGQRLFTVEEANELVPALQLLFGRLAQVKTELEPVIQALGGAEVALGLLKREIDAPEDHEEEAEALQRLAAEIAAAAERINELGCVVKDLDSGLVDFYSVVDGEPALLCWQFGEPAVTHWHSLEEGFAGRKPIDGLELEPPTFVN